MKRNIVLLGLISAYRIIQHAERKNAFFMLGGDVYIDKGNLNEALCIELGLDYRSISVKEFKAAVNKAEIEFKSYSTEVV